MSDFSKYVLEKQEQMLKEEPLEKTRGYITFPHFGQGSIHQEPYRIQNQGQLVNRARLVADSGRKESISGIPLQNISDKKVVDQIINADAMDAWNSWNADPLGGGMDLRTASQIIPVNDPRSKASMARAGLRDKSMAFAVGDSPVPHEAQHTVFSNIAARHNATVRNALAQRAVGAMDEKARLASELVAEYHGYSPDNHEEMITTHQGYLNNPELRAKIHMELGLNQPYQQSQFYEHMRRGHDQMMEFGRNIRPEDITQEVQNTKFHGLTPTPPQKFNDIVPLLQGARPEDFLSEGDEAHFEEQMKPFKGRRMETQPKIRKSAFIPARFLTGIPVENQDLSDYQEIAINMSGQDSILKYTEAARQMVNGEPMDIGVFRKNLAFYEDDLAAAALATYFIRIDEKNKATLQDIVDSNEMESALQKQEAAVPITALEIAPTLPESIDSANAIQRAVKAGNINAVKLNGKHSKGSMVAQDPQDRRLYLLKPGSGKNSPARGVNEDLSTQSEREAAFYHVAEILGIDENFPKADLILINGHQTAVMELLPVSFKNMGERKQQDPNIAPIILRPYLANGMLFKWATIDYILGNPDRHSQNIMINPYNNKVVLIDHGSSMAGRSFSPATDDNSFIPFYLRAWTGKKFTMMSPSERVHFMPGLDRRAEQVFEEWIEDLDEQKIEEALRRYHIDPSAAIERLQRIKMLPGPKWKVLNELWAGAIED